MIESCEQQINSSVQLLVTDYICGQGAGSDPAVRSITDYPLLGCIRSPHELIVTDLSDSRHEQVRLDLGDYSVVALMQSDES